MLNVDDYAMLMNMKSPIPPKLTYKYTLLARVVLLPLVVYLNMLLHHTIFIGLERAPGTNTPAKSLL